MTFGRTHVTDDKTLPVQRPPQVKPEPAPEPEPPKWQEPAVDAQAELDPRGNQASHSKQMNDAYALACEHPMEWKVQSRFRTLFGAYRDRYTVPAPPETAAAKKARNAR